MYEEHKPVLECSWNGEVSGFVIQADIFVSFIKSVYLFVCTFQSSATAETWNRRHTHLCLCSSSSLYVLGDMPIL